jgi:hypothetical protein
MSKGSSPRPYSVNQKTFDANWDRIFKKGNDMQVRVREENEIGKCGCGRSPTGKCIGWHGLTEEQYEIELENYMTNKTDEKGEPT